MKKRKVELISLLAILLIPLAFFYSSYTTGTKPDGVEIKVTQPAPRVTTQRIRAGTFSSVIESFGEVRAKDNLTLLSQASGKVIWKSKALFVGNVVKKGELLIRIEDENYRLALANAKTNLARSRLALLQEQRKQKRAEKDWQRSGIAGTPSDLVLRIPQLNMAKAQFNAAQEEVAHAQSNLANTKVTAPFEAIVTAQSITLGSTVLEHGTIATLKSVSSAEIKVELSEEEWRQLPVTLHGENALVHSTHRGEQQWTGTIDNLDLFVNESNRTRTMTIKVESPLSQTPPLFFGSFVQIKLDGKAHANAFRIPSSSITSDGDFWYEQEGKLAKHKAVVLFKGQKLVGIERGNLPNKLNVVVRPLAKYVDGMVVDSVVIEGSDNVD